MREQLFAVAYGRFFDVVQQTRRLDRLTALLVNEFQVARFVGFIGHGLCVSQI